jgi:hypothetical protein
MCSPEYKMMLGAQASWLPAMLLTSEWVKEFITALSEVV